MHVHIACTVSDFDFLFPVIILSLLVFLVNHVAVSLKLITIPLMKLRGPSSTKWTLITPE